MAKLNNGRKTVYNNITDEDKLKQVNEENLQLEDDFLEYLISTDRAFLVLEFRKQQKQTFR